MNQYKYSFIILFLSSFFFILGIVNAGSNIGGFWAKINSNSLVGFQSFIEKETGNTNIYFNIILPLLNLNIFFYLGFIGFSISFIIIKIKK